MRVARSARSSAQQSNSQEVEQSPILSSSEHPASSMNREFTSAEEQPEDDWRPPADDDQESTSDVYRVPESSAEVLRRLRDQRVELNKENLQEAKVEGVRKKPRFFNERQESARRIPFEDDDEDEDEGPRRTQHRARDDVRAGGEGNGVEPEEDDDDEDDAFETDDRPADVVRRVEQPAVGRSGNVPRQRLDNRSTGVSGDWQRVFNRNTGVTQDRKQAQRQAANQTQEEPRRAHQEPSPSVEEENDGQIPYRQINQLAKTTVALRGQRKVQVRRPWSEQATARLIELIEDDRYGTSWVTIEHLKDPLLEGRGQVALKDKARNVKMDFLK